MMRTKASRNAVPAYPRSPLLWLSAAALSVVLPVGTHSPGPAAALAAEGDEDPEVMAQAKQHYKLGLDAYNAGKLDVAIKELKKAHLLSRRPAILLNIGLTYRKNKDWDMATYYYQKFLKDAPADDKARPQAEAALRRAAEMAHRVKDGLVLGVDDLLRVDGRWAVVMEYISGADLQELLALGPIPPRPLCEIVTEVTSALPVSPSPVMICTRSRG